MYEHFEALKRSDVFSNLNDIQLANLAAIGQHRTYEEGELIVTEDSKAEACFFLLAGRVDIEIRAIYAGRGPQKLTTLKRGELFGELSLVDGFLRSATARAVDAAELVAFDNAQLEELMENDPAVGYTIMRNIANVLSTRIRSTNMKLRNALSDILYY